jgi:hypothetical protein
MFKIIPIGFIREAGKYSFVRGGEVDLDAYMAFLDAFNEFIGHRPKPFKPFKEGNFKL